MMFDFQEVSDSDFDDTIRQKIKRGTNSGYLDEEFETTKDFPIIGDYHFRIQDEKEIMELQKLKKWSPPICIQSSFNNSSDGFKSRLDMLLSNIDKHRVSFENAYPSQAHGFYQLADSYDQSSAVEAILQNQRIEDIRKGVEKLEIKEIKPTFIKRKGKKKEQVEGQMKAEGPEIKKLCKKINRMTITEEDC